MSRQLCEPIFLKNVFVLVLIKQKDVNLTTKSLVSIYIHFFGFKLFYFSFAETCVVASLTLQVFVQNYCKVLPIGSKASWKCCL